MEDGHERAELIRQLDNERDAYIEPLKTAHNALVAGVPLSEGRHANLNSQEKLGCGCAKNARSNEEADQQAVIGAAADEATMMNAPTDKLDPESSFCVSEALKPRNFDEEGIREHLKTSSRWPRARYYAETLFSGGTDLACDGPVILKAEDDKKTLTFCMLWETDTDGHTVGRHVTMERYGRSAAIWKALSAKPLMMLAAAGRILHIGALSPSTFAALHYTNCDTHPLERIAQLMTDINASHADLLSAFWPDERICRGSRFYFSYLTCTDNETCHSLQGLAPCVMEGGFLAGWHIQRYRSCVCLSLAGDPVGKVQQTFGGKVSTGFVYDTFAPWDVLNIVAMPCASIISLDLEMMRTPAPDLCCGPEAFVIKLLSEYRLANYHLDTFVGCVSGLFTPHVDCSKTFDSLVILEHLYDFDSG